MILPNSRSPLRMLCGFIAIIVLAYLVEIFFLGASAFERGTGRSFHHETAPMAFWTPFTLFALFGAATGYLCVDWKRALSLIGVLEARDQRMLDGVGAEKARRTQQNQLLGVGLASGIMTGLLFLLGRQFFFVR